MHTGVGGSAGWMLEYGYLMSATLRHWFMQDARPDGRLVGVQYRLVIQFFMVAAVIVANVANVFTINAGVPANPLGHNVSPTWRDARPNFVIVTCVGTPGAIILLAVLLAYARYKRLLLW